MTTISTLAELKKAGKPLNKSRLYELLVDLGIKPVGARQRPQQYPPDTAERILQHLGFSGGAANGRSEGHLPHTPPKIRRRAGILSLSQLKTHKPRRKK
jgi:hypothetical protein